MANGDIKQLDFRQFRVLLLDGQSASHSGVWVEWPPGLHQKSFHATLLEEGATDAQIELMVSNAETKPTDATDGPIISTLTTAVLASTDGESWRWVKAKKIAGTTPIGTTVTGVGVKPA